MKIELSDKEADQVWGALAWYVRFIENGKKETKVSIRRVMDRIHKRQYAENAKGLATRDQLRGQRLGED